MPLKFLKNSLEAMDAWPTSMTEKSQLIIDCERSGHTYIKNISGKLDLVNFYWWELWWRKITGEI